jgi:hypothetical protein
LPSMRPPVAWPINSVFLVRSTDTDAVQIKVYLPLLRGRYNGLFGRLLRVCLLMWRGRLSQSRRPLSRALRVWARSRRFQDLGQIRIVIASIFMMSMMRSRGQQSLLYHSSDLLHDVGLRVLLPTVVAFYSTSNSQRDQLSYRTSSDNAFRFLRIGRSAG